MSEGRDENESRANVKMLEDSIRAAVDYNRAENQVSYAECIGVLEILKTELLIEAMKIRTEGDDDP